MNCLDHNLFEKILLIWLRSMGEAEPNDFPVATRKEMEARWDAEKKQ